MEDYRLIVSMWKNLFKDVFLWIGEKEDKYLVWSRSPILYSARLDGYDTSGYVMKFEETDRDFFFKRLLRLFSSGRGGSAEAIVAKSLPAFQEFLKTISSDERKRVERVVSTLFRENKKSIGLYGSWVIADRSPWLVCGDIFEHGLVKHIHISGGVCVARLGGRYCLTTQGEGGIYREMQVFDSEWDFFSYLLSEVIGYQSEVAACIIKKMQLQGKIEFFQSIDPVSRQCVEIVCGKGEVKDQIE